MRVLSVESEFGALDVQLDRLEFLAGQLCRVETEGMLHVPVVAVEFHDDLPACNVTRNRT
jgi:hypothetical protein